MPTTIFFNFNSRVKVIKTVTDPIFPIYFPPNFEIQILAMILLEEGGYITFKEAKLMKKKRFQNMNFGKKQHLSCKFSKNYDFSVAPGAKKD